MQKYSKKNAIIRIRLVEINLTFNIFRAPRRCFLIYTSIYIADATQSLAIGWTLPKNFSKPLQVLVSKNDYLLRERLPVFFSFFFPCCFFCPVRSKLIELDFSATSSARMILQFHSVKRCSLLSIHFDRVHLLRKVVFRIPRCKLTGRTEFSSVMCFTDVFV